MRKLIFISSAMLLAGSIAQAALVGEWKFEDGLATDTSGNGYDGTIVGSLTSISGVEAGTDAFEFDSTANYVSIPAGVFATVGNEISIAMWTFGDADVLGDGVTPNSAFGANVRDTLHSHTPWSNGALYWDAGGKRDNYSPSPASKYEGKWNHMVFTLNVTTGQKRVYINGVQDSPDWNRTDLSAISGIDSFFIGRAADSAKAYHGKLDEFQIYDEALDATAVSNLYASYTVDAYATAIIETSELSGNIPFEVVFNGTNSLASGEITDYDWDFGDGNVAAGPLATNTYTVSGTYTASLAIATSEGATGISTVEIIAQSYVGTELAVTVEGTETNNPPSFSIDDLAQTAFLSSTGEGTGAATTGNLFDGTIGNTDDSISGTGEVRWDSTSSVTINFDVSENTLGYDISEISSIAGWSSLGGGRANQGYGITVTYVDDTQAILTDPEHWAPNPDGESYWTKVTFSETNGLAMVRGIKSITFSGFYNANASGVVVGREIDIFGTPTTVDYVNAGIAATPKTGAPPLEVAFDGSVSVSTANIVSYSWNFGDGNTASGAMVTNTYPISGDYTAQLIVGDENGLMATNTVEIKVLDFVTAAASATPLTGESPLEVAFEGTNSASSGTILSYDWDFGDGNTASGMMVTNTYNVSGPYTATLVVTDSNGLTDSTTVDLAVSKALNINYIQYSEQIPTGTIPEVSSNDLAQTAYLSSTGTGGNESAQHAQLFNGLIGNQDGDANDSGEVRLTAGDAITVTFDTSVNTLGYDIDMIETFAGWTATTYDGLEATNNLSRSNQGYEIIVGFADGSFGTMAGPQHWEPNGEAVWTNSVGTDVNDTYWTKVGFINASSGAMLSNVKSITFGISENARPGSVVIYREFDVYGVPSTGYYPSSIVLNSFDGGNALTWASGGAYDYSVQTNLDLVYGEWGTVTNVLGTPPETTVILPPKTADQMFMRVIVE
jgi:PKD repeat protein